jgi:RNA polymerase sigma factor (sigma-70 family)
MSLDTERLYDYWPLLLSFVRGRLHGRDDMLAEDIAAATLERAVRAAHTYQDRPAGPKMWLLTVAAHLLTDHARQRANQPHYDIATVRLRQARLDAGSDRHADMLDVQAALSTLPDAYRDAAWLRAQGVPFRDIGTSPATAHRHTRFAYRLLRSRLARRAS